MSHSTRTTKPRKLKQKVDYRKQLFNSGKIGRIEKIQVSTERITQLNGIFFDLDLDLIKRSRLVKGKFEDPSAFYNKIVKKWLSRHPVLNKAEVRMTGKGLHVILWFDEPVDFAVENRERWAAIVQVVQAALPIDPDQPGITATTRSIGSVNSKNDVRVKRLRKGKPVSHDEVMSLHQQMVSSPFRTVLGILSGEERISPCPFCKKEETTLVRMEHVGDCYGSCGKVGLEKLYELILKDRAP